jgi:hypothetical protein
MIVTQTQKLRKILTRIENELESESRDGSLRLHAAYFSVLSYPNPER